MFFSKLNLTGSATHRKCPKFCTLSQNILVVHVPEGIEKPYGCSKGFFLRTGPNSQKLSRNEIIRFFQKEGRVRFDELINAKADFKKSFDEKAYQRLMQMAQISPVLDKVEILKNMDCLQMLKGKPHLTNTGVLFLASSIEFLMPQATITCALYKGNTKVTILDRKDFTSNVINNIESAIIFLKQHLKLGYKIEKIRREEIEEIPEIALREAVINAVCHRDYFEAGACTMIEIFDDRVEISNPGGLPSGLSEKDFGKKSVTRNPVIASLFYRIDYIEKMGTGIQRIKNACKQNKNAQPKFEFGSFFTVIFTRAAINRVGEKDGVKDGVSIGVKDGVNFGENFGVKLTDNQVKILELIGANPYITSPELANQIGITKRNIEINISKLKSKDLLKRVGADKGGHWEIVK